MMPIAMTEVTGTGAMSIMNNPTKHKKHFILACHDCSGGMAVTAGWGSASAYKLLMTFQNHSCLVTTRYMPIKQLGEIGPKPMIAKTANMERHLSWVKFMAV